MVVRLSRHLAVVSVVALMLGGCTEFPASGPTIDELNDSLANSNALGLRIVEVTPEIGRILATPPLPPAPPTIKTADDAAVERIGAGDVLSVAIYEAGSSLFAKRALLSSSSGGVDTSASAENFPKVQVDRQGDITIPYAGKIKAAGRTPHEVERTIERQLQNKAAEPRALVGVTSNLANTFVLSGEIKAPGRFPLTLAHERLFDAIAIAGGALRSMQETSVEFTRDGQTSVFPLTQLGPGNAQDVLLAPGDRIRLVYQPRSFTVFGASGRVSQVSFDTPKLLLAEGIARAGGPAEERADPTGVYLFRFEPPETAKRLGIDASDATPVIYHLDLIDPTSYFVMERVEMQDKDLIYVANARVNRLQKLLSLLSSVATPVALAKTLSQ